MEVLGAWEAAVGQKWLGEVAHDALERLAALLPRLWAE